MYKKICSFPYLMLYLCDMSNIGVLCVRGMMRLLGKQPLKVHYFWADVIAWVLRVPLRYRRDTMVTNISRSFPTARYAEVRALVKANYRHIAELIVEAIWFGASDLERLRKQRIVEFSNLDTLSEIFAKGRSVMILDTHCGNWELLGGVLAYNYSGIEPPFTEENFHVVYKALSNKLWDRVFYENRRAPMPGYEGQLESSGLLRFMLKNRENQKIYLINNDQYPSQAGCDVGRFLNQDTTALKAAPSLAVKLGMAVVYMEMKNDRRGHYSITFKTITEDASRMTPEEITEIYCRNLEAEISSVPANWLWTHKRWKNHKDKIF